MSSVDDERCRKCARAVLTGLIANAALAMVKTAVGLAEGSHALLADGANSTSDVIYCAAALILVRVAAKEPDHEHPHGHGQSESIASLLIGAFIITTAVAIFYESLRAVIGGEPGRGSMTALGVALATMVAKTGLVAYTLRVARQTANPAVAALAADHRSDVYAAVTVVAGVAAASLGYPVLDPVAGAAVSFFILATGLGVVRGAVADLMNTLPAGGLAGEVAALAAGVHGVRGIADLRAYRFGPHLVLQVEIGVDPRLSVAEGHAIATAVERTLVEQMEHVRRAFTRVNPSGVQRERVACRLRLAPRRAPPSATRRLGVCSPVSALHGRLVQRLSLEQPAGPHLGTGAAVSRLRVPHKSRAAPLLQMARVVRRRHCWPAASPTRQGRSAA